MLLHRVHAVNTAPESENKIHDDRIAANYGFRGGLVPGVTVYGYMTLPVLDHFGEQWLDRGGMSVRLRAPVYDGEDIAIEADPVDGGRIEIVLEGGRASGVAWLNHEIDAPSSERAAPPLPSHDARPPASRESLSAGVVLGTLIKKLAPEDRPISAPLPPVIGPGKAAHPTRLLALSNELLMSNVVLGPWIHASSEVSNFSSVHDGDEITVAGRVEEAYERKGHEFAVLDIVLRSGARTVQTVRHTVIWRLRS